LFQIRIRLDPKLFGPKDLDPKLLILDPDPPLFHTKLRNIFFKIYKKVSKFILSAHTILENFTKLKISTHFCLHIDQN